MTTKGMLTKLKASSKLRGLDANTHKNNQETELEFVKDSASLET
jgi:hypothetical protein